MTSVPPKHFTVLMWAVLITGGGQIWLDHQWPGSPARWLAFWANTLLVLGWMGYQISTGYERRRPYWSGESWRRYLRMAAMPVAALMVFMALVIAFDARPGFFGARGSVWRLAFIVVDMTLMLFGTIGAGMAIDWLGRGEPSEPFTRTRWFRRRQTT
jgi:hypothetical protein